MVCREEKEAALQRFVQSSLDAACDAQVDITLLARNLESPGARAVAKMMSDAGARIAVRAIVLDTEPSAAVSGVSLAEIEGASLRVLRDGRFNAAHEQLVCGPARVWIGDCMRREPVKRDAFELFHDDNLVATRHAEASFERLWAKAKVAKPEMNGLVSGLVAASQASGPSAARPVSGR
jgi:hypothetical protein